LGSIGRRFTSELHPVLFDLAGVVVTLPRIAPSRIEVTRSASSARDSTTRPLSAALESLAAARLESCSSTLTLAFRARDACLRQPAMDG
jgi:hypothetical protein